MITQILIGGKAGQGPNIVTQLVGEALIEKGFYVFFSRDYQSLIRGGHNFNTLTFSNEQVLSNKSKSDILVCLDEETGKIHKKEIENNAIILEDKLGHENNMFFAGALFKILCLDFNFLENKLKKLKNFEQNIEFAKKGFETTSKTCKVVLNKEKKGKFLNGTQGITEGAMKSGIEGYYAYPMTPATPLLFELAQKEGEKLKVVELENEISVVMAALGSSACGKRVLIGTSGGGFDLMTEGLSMADQAEIPLVIYLATRPGPGTGVATYTSQGDLNLALGSGHGELFRIVVSPGDPLEAEELTNQTFLLSQKFKVACIILNDKHLAESFYTIKEEANILDIKDKTELKRFNSYETEGEEIATENAEIIKKNFNIKLKKQKEIENFCKTFKQYKIYGKNNSKNVIISYGSPKGAILDSIKELDCKFIHVIHLSPFPDIEKELKDKNLILVENSATGQLANLIREKTGIKIEDKNKILRYDGRPFFSDELKEEIKRRLR